MKRNKKAFTLVELMLAVAFLGTLLLSIALLTMQLINIYTKGATMRAINSTGSSMMRDIRSSIMSSANYPENLDTKSQDYIWKDQTTAGMFCTGSYTYVWNYQQAMMAAHRDPSLTYYYIEIDDTNKTQAYGFARVKDSGCKRFEALKKDPTNGTNGNGKISASNEDEVHVLLDGKRSGEGTDLALYDFSVITATRSNKLSNKGLYDISFVLGTMRGGVNVTSSSNYCEKSTTSSNASEQSYADTEMNYCSVNRFEFTVRQSGINL